MSRRRSLSAGALRVVAFAAALAVIVALWLHSRAQSPPRPRLLGLGDALSATGMGPSVGEALVVNGVHVQNESAHLAQDLDAALPRLRQACVMPAESLAAALRSVAAEQPAVDAPDSVNVERGPGRAALTCRIAGGERRRYLHARESDGGVSIRALESDGPLPSFGGDETHDAAGEDLRGLPRPTHSRRLLSVFSPDRRYGMVQFLLPPGSLEAAAASYRARVEDAGFVVSTPAGDAPDMQTLLAERRGRRVLVVIDGGASADGRIIATLLDQD